MKSRILIRNKITLIALTGFILGSIFFSGSRKIIYLTSTDRFCASCHVHPQTHTSWKLSTHFDNPSGIKVHCVECHLPPQGEGYVKAKALTGIIDLYGKLFKDSSEFNWEEKSLPEYAVNHTFEISCKKCHQNLFPLTLTKEGDEAHLYYTDHDDKLHCINCHLQVGHYSENAVHAKNVSFGTEVKEKEVIFTKPAKIEKFEDFTEYIPGTSVKFDMVAIPGGTFQMGSSPDQKAGHPNERPVRQTELSPFFIAKTEVTWNEYLSFYYATAAEGRTSGQNKKQNSDPDAITGATPPWGAPDQGWGMGKLPAITMTYHAAETYCKWLSKVTGKKYRLPTEAEWEYACRGETTGSYFFEGKPKDFRGKGVFGKIFSKNRDEIYQYINFIGSGIGKTIESGEVKSNPFGLQNMPGNIAEFCLDWYAPDAYEQYNNDTLINPGGPEKGTEHVIRGGSFKSTAENVRCASRNYTKTDKWLLTDPQMPKSIWWYSDCNHVGFRVICEGKAKGKAKAKAKAKDEE